MELSLPKDEETRLITTVDGVVDVGERMRTAAIMLAQLSRQSALPNADLAAIGHIRARIIHEMEFLEKDRLVDALQTAQWRDGPDEAGEAGEERREVKRRHAVKLSKHDPSGNILVRHGIWANHCMTCQLIIV